MDLSDSEEPQRHRDMYQSDDDGLDDDDQDEDEKAAYYYEKEYESEDYEQQEAISIIDDNLDLYNSPPGKKS